MPGYPPHLRYIRYIRGTGPARLPTRRSFLTLSFFKSFCNLTEGPLQRNFGLSNRIALGLLSRLGPCARWRPKRIQSAHYRKPSSTLSNQQDDKYLLDSWEQIGRA